MTWTGAFGRACRVLLYAIVRGLALTRISPNVLTFLGLVINTIAAILFGYANTSNYGRLFPYAGLVIIGAGIFDMVDGRVARATGQVTTFGAFFYLVLVAFVMVSSVMVSYTRARAESLIGSCKVGFMERPERVVLVIIGALFARFGAMAPVLWVLAVLSTITIIHRITYTYQQTRILDAQAAEAAAQQQAVAASKEGNKPQPTKGKGPQQIPSFN
jgi:CDP-diacylglycerol--glycerol-3-phosphate 3-phosphatidyltransferase